MEERLTADKLRSLLELGAWRGIQACRDASHTHDPAMMCGIILHLWDRDEEKERRLSALEESEAQRCQATSSLQDVVETISHLRRLQQATARNVDELDRLLLEVTPSGP